MSLLLSMISPCLKHQALRLTSKTENSFTVKVLHLFYAEILNLSCSRGNDIIHCWHLISVRTSNLEFLNQEGKK